MHFSDLSLGELSLPWKNEKTFTLRKKGPYSELFCSVFSPNAGKYGPE